ncbi:TetR/AcrR family transcriptional regulator [Clostridium sp. P21]|uniref:TetR/AcrR family transcriptional regulator n=1 Tax=Clostridium muellerianum TaxID=2716538 RepID=A0A7Y0EKS7_9CLOT|nr:TetR/AcrR family transcriptional regulator [Clostridium muellerianum]NMM65304.1 TetR/AcrR family transcriptional regulator [Clostridium muellerianum]
MDKKEIKRYRNMSYFIEAAVHIMDEEGIEFVTIRKVSDLAGYNSATLYNYFESLDELILFASIRYLKEYTLNLKEYIKSAKNSLERYYKIWECFCRYSFSNPKIYNNIFFGNHSNSIFQIIKEYYSIFPEELGEHPEELMPMLLKSNLYERNLALLKILAADGYLKEGCLNDINEMTILLYQGMITKILNNEETFNIEDCSETMLRYIKQITTSFKN